MYRTVCFVAVLFFSGSCSALAATHPNVILVLIDDMGWSDLSCFGNQKARTPHIDRLAAEGIRFSQFYVNAPICSPSRVALTTGQYPQRWRITSYLSNRAENQKRGMAQWLDPRAPSLARFLQQNGYATGHFGKWHMGGQRDVDEAPMITEYGFDESLTNFEGLGPRLLGLCDAQDGTPPVRHSLGSENLGRGPVIWHDRSQLTSAYVGAAIAFLDRAVAEDRPFCINVWPDDVHSPFYPPRDKRVGGSKRAKYRRVLEAMDEQLAPLFDHIRQRPALCANTLILLCSDNGHEPGAGSSRPFRGAKATLYEGGIRSPLIVWGPGLIAAEKAGVRNDTSVLSAIDLVPSLLKLCGVLSSVDAQFDGEQLAGTLMGRTSDSRQAPLFWRRPPDRKRPAGPSSAPQPDLAVRDGKWKLLCEFDGTKSELYDLAGDAKEAINVASHHPEVTQRLTKALLKWDRSVRADVDSSIHIDAAEPIRN